MCKQEERSRLLEIPDTGVEREKLPKRPISAKKAPLVQLQTDIASVSGFIYLCTFILFYVILFIVELLGSFFKLMNCIFSGRVTLLLWMNVQRSWTTLSGKEVLISVIFFFSSYSPHSPFIFLILLSPPMLLPLLLTPPCFYKRATFAFLLTFLKTSKITITQSRTFREKTTNSIP